MNADKFPMKSAVDGAWPLTPDELKALLSLLQQHPFSSDQRLLATIDMLRSEVKYLQVVKP